MTELPEDGRRLADEQYRGPDEDRPVQVVPGDLMQASDLAWKHLSDWMSDTDVDRFVCRYGGLLTWLERSDGGPRTVALDRRRVLLLLARAIAWVKPGKQDLLPAPPPREVADDMLVDPRPPVPVLERISEVPVLTAAGELHDVPGYHPGSRCFYAPAAGLEAPAVPTAPTAAELAAARGLLVDELLHDFPFAGKAERAHAIALLLLPLVRDLIDGPTPLHVIDAPTPGTGKTLLARALLLPARGVARCEELGEAHGPDEWRKALTAKLRQAPIAIVFDNVRRTLDSGHLARAITAEVYEDRLLGVSDTVRLPVRCAWVATGNNVRLSDEMARRTARIRLDSGEELPELRDRFRHPDLLGWAAGHRGELIAAALTLARAWLAAGRPEPAQVPRLGMFEQWSTVIGGILEHAGIDGLLANLEEVRASEQDTAWFEFLDAVHGAHGDAPFRTKDVVELAAEHLELGEPTDPARTVQRLGSQLRTVIDRPMAGLVLRRGELDRARVRRWRIESLMSADGEPDPDVLRAEEYLRGHDGQERP